MKIVNSSFEVVSNVNGKDILKNLEKIGRVCYKSENLITDDSATKFVANIIKNGHEAIIEHHSITVKIICDRGVSHEIVRHRLASYAQESSRFCNYSKNKFDNEITVIKPCFWEKEDKTRWNYLDLKYMIWEDNCLKAESNYFELLKLGATPEQARSVLPNSLKTEIIATMNLREWRHFFKLRTSKFAHPQIREIAIPLLNEFKTLIPIIFDDILE